MGAWGSGSFENDAAYDWAGALSRKKGAAGPKYIRNSLSGIADADEGEYIDSDDACEAVAAAEVVAAAAGRPSTAKVQEFVGTDPVEGLPGKVRAWLEANPFTPDEGLLELARRAVKRARSEDSELKELWDDAGDKKWPRAMDDLERRLSGGGGGTVEKAPKKGPRKGR
jgi:hypothetical protein